MQGLFDTLGWPAAQAIEGITWLVGDAGLAIIIAVLIARASLLPLARRHYRMQAATARLYPKLQALHEELKDQPEELESRMRAMYRAERATPYGWMVFPVVQVALLLLLIFGVYLGLAGASGLWGWIPDLGQMTVNSLPGWILVGLILVVIETRMALGLRGSEGRTRTLLIISMVAWGLGSICMTPFLPVGVELAILTAVIWSVIEMRILARLRDAAARGGEAVLL